jgi:hypothetical protein
MYYANIDRKYNYVYKLTNVVNGKIYIGVHRTDNLDDGYMGSGNLLAKAKNKYGTDNFKKEIIEFFPTYKEALEAEKELVTIDFINENTNYNLKEGGYGNCKWSKKMSDEIKEMRRKMWSDPEFRKKVITPKYRKRRSDSAINWIQNNPERHAERMEKINKNPDKIAKMAEKHRGMKRSEEAKKNMSEGMKAAFLKNGPKSKGGGMKYIYNPVEKKAKRIEANEEIPDGWVKGSGPKNSWNYLNLHKNSVFAYDPVTMQERRFKNEDEIPNNFIKGRKPKQ